MAYKHENLVNAIMLDLQKIFRNKIKIYKRHVGKFKTESGRSIYISRKGQSDIWGIVNICGVGVHFEIEVKVGRDQLTDEQLNWSDMVFKMGGIFVEARDDSESSVQEFVESVNNIRRLIREGGLH